MKTKHIAYVAIIVFSIGCKGKTIDPVKATAVELKLAALQNESKPWSVTSGSVTKDGFDVSSQFDGFTLTFGEFTYSSKNGLNSAWPSTGTWEFSNDNPNKILRNDGVLMDATVANNSLTLKFRVSDVGGRSNGLDGEYVFVLSE